MTDAALLRKLRALPPDKQQNVADYIDFLLQRSDTPAPSQPFYGLWADLAVDVEAEEINEARREMWSSFPREDAV